MSEEQTTGPSSSEGKAASASEVMKQAAEARKKRADKKALETSSGVAIEQPEDSNRFDEDVPGVKGAKTNLAEAFQLFSPQLPPEAITGIADATGNIYNEILTSEYPDGVDEAKLGRLADYLKAVGLKREPDGVPEEEKVAKNVVGEWFPELTDDQRKYIVDQLDPLTDDDTKEAAPEEEVKNLEAVAKEAEKVRGEVKNAIEEEMVSAGDDEARKAKLQGYQERASEIESKLHKFLHPEDPGRTWLRRGGKLGGYILLAMFIGLILELHWLHNAARTK
jgi:hypothetical protein